MGSSRLVQTLALVGALGLAAAACGAGSDVSAGSGTSTTLPGSGGDESSPVLIASEMDRASVDPGAPVGELSSGFNNAGFDLMRTQPLDDNLVFSPLSIGHALLMARGAADEPTGAKIDAAFALPAGVSAHEAWNSVDQMIAASVGTATDVDGEPSPSITIADRIWPREGFSPTAEWIDLLGLYHGADVQPIDITQPEVSREIINQWVSDNTEALIPELLPQGFIHERTVLVLTDAVYFKAQWRSIFGKYGEVTAPFHLLDGSTVDVSLMSDLEQPGGRMIGDGFAAAELPYLGDEYSMLLVVPDEGRFEEFRGLMDDEFLQTVDAGLTTGPWELQMPKWETTSAIDLLDWLTAMGAAPGNYPGIKDGVVLDAAVHGADIAVDEVGTVAAAATALGFAESGPPEPEVTITVDRPFFYVVRHNETGMVLFVGQVTNPLA